MSYANFVHLHTHSQYSLLDGACRIDQVIALAQEYRMPAVALTDHGNLFGAIEFYKAARRAKIKPILGCEAYVAGGSRFERRPSNAYPDGGFHLVLLVKNLEGYQNLMKLASAAYLEGFYHKPRIDKELLRRYSGGLIATSACLKGEVNWRLTRGETDQAVFVANELEEIFGKGNFYLEIQDHGITLERQLLPKVITLHRETGIPLVASNDCHYLKKTHSRAHECLLCIQTGKTMDDPQRMKFDTDQVYFKTPEEMQTLFGEYPDALSNTVEIAERCNLELEMDRPLLPRFQVPSNYKTEADYLLDLCEAGMAERYPVITEEIRARLEYELGVINKMNYAGYFLIVRDFCEQARKMGISVGPGRGSAAGSLVAYVLRITNVDPIKFELLFERFLNPERISMPDIDIDFSDRGRDQIIKYVIEKYGADNVCQIVTFGTMAARLVVRDVGRVMGMAYGDVDKIAKMIPSTIGISLDEAIAQVPELQAMEKSNVQIKELLAHSRVLEGLARHCSTHAAGVVIAPTALTDYVPLCRAGGEEVITQYDMKMVESIGLLKMDFLGLRTLTVLDDTIALLKRSNANYTVDLDNLDLEDPEVYALFARGETVGIFQFESPGMRDYLRRLQPTSFTDLTVMNALYRPGPLDSGMIDVYINRKNGREEVKFLHPILENILGSTYGVIVFQEQVLSIANKLAGYSLGRADLLRKAMGKKDAELMAQQKAEFLAGAKSMNIADEIAIEVFNQIETFARYGFNKAHSTCYAFVAYQTAHMKVHHPAEFMAAMLTSEMGDSGRVNVLLEECRRMKIQVLPPDVNESAFDFTVIGGAIRFGLQAVKNVGENTARAITEARNDGPFTSVAELSGRIEPKMLNRRALESLVASGATDTIKGHRSQKFLIVEPSLEYGHKVFAQSGVADLFSLAGGAPARVEPALPPLDEWPTGDKMAREKEALGFYLTGHPLDRFRSELPMFTTCSIAELAYRQDGKDVTVGGIVLAVKKKLDKKGNTMGFVTLEDFSGQTELVVFSSCFEKAREFLDADSLVLVTGRLSIREGDSPKVVANEIVPLERVTQKYDCQLVVKITSASEEQLDRVCGWLDQQKGDSPVMFVARENGSEVYISSKKYRVNLDFALLERLKGALGDAGAYIWPINSRADQNPASTQRWQRQS